MRGRWSRATAPVAIALLGMAAAPPAWAQKPIPESIRMMEPHRLRIGDYVRAWPAPPGPVVQGPVVAVSSTTLTLAGREEAALVDLTQMDHMQVRRIHGHYRRGALIGAGLGLVASALLVTRELFGREVGGWERAGWTAAATAAGAGIGVGVARLTRDVVWEPVDLVTLKPHHADAGAAMRLSYTLRF
jgi:hypothetical protein